MVDASLLKSALDYYVENEPANRLPDGMRIFNKPLLGFAAAGDPIFKEFKKEEIIGSLFVLPEEWLPEAKTVISYFLPFSEHIRSSNYGGPPTSIEWLHARFLGEEFNQDVRKFLLAELEKKGGKSIVPALHENYFADYDNFSSNWSERHIAYAAGLGSFGLNRGLITEKGLAGRFGSLITTLFFPATTRSSGGVFENCPYYADESCSACVKRCPSGAIKKEGKDKAACNQYTRVEDHLQEIRLQFGYGHSVCGKCQVNVPCEDKIPIR